MSQSSLTLVNCERCFCIREVTKRYEWGLRDSNEKVVGGLLGRDSLGFMASEKWMGFWKQTDAKFSPCSL